jgi:hypothetical protein
MEQPMPDVSEFGDNLSDLGPEQTTRSDPDTVDSMGVPMQSAPASTENDIDIDDIMGGNFADGFATGSDLPSESAPRDMVQSSQDDLLSGTGGLDDLPMDSDPESTNRRTADDAPDLDDDFLKQFESNTDFDDLSNMLDQSSAMANKDGGNDTDDDIADMFSSDIPNFGDDFEATPKQKRASGNKKKGKKKSKSGLGFFLMACALAGIGGGGWAFQDDVMQAAPWSRSVYDAIGLSAGQSAAARLPFTLETIGGLETVRRDGKVLYAMRGRVTHTGDEPRAVPQIRLSVFKTEGQRAVVVNEVTIPPPVPELEPGQTADFRIVFDPKDGAETSTKFVLPEETAANPEKTTADPAAQ